MSSESADLTCPHPSEPMPGTQTTSDTGKSQKGKRTCSHCSEEGHTKTKKGKISCPKLLN